MSSLRALFSGRAVRVAVVRSHPGGKAFWKYLNDHWGVFGKTPVHVSVRLMRKLSRGD